MGGSDPLRYMIISLILLISSVLASQRAYFSIPVPEIQSRNNYPTHIVLTFHQQSPDCKGLWKEYEKLCEIGQKYMGCPSFLAKPVSIQNDQSGLYAEYEFAGAIASFMEEVRSVFPHAVTRTLIKGSSSKLSSFPSGLVFDFANIQLKNSPNALNDLRPVELKVMSFNVHLLKERRNYPKEEMNAKFKELPSIVKKIVHEISKFSPDVVLLQEVPNDTFGSGDNRKLSASLNGLGYSYCYCQKASTFLDNCIYSRYKLKGQSSAVLETDNGKPKRGLVSASIKVNGREITVISTHVNKFNEQALNDHLSQNHPSTNPVIIGADFNMDLTQNTNWVKSYTSVHMLNPLCSAYPMTAAEDEDFQTGKPVDFILLSPGAKDILNVKGMIQFGQFISDHLPVIVTLQIFPK